MRSLLKSLFVCAIMLSVVCVVAQCFNPDLNNGVVLTCEGTCPEGFVCQDGKCRANPAGDAAAAVGDQGDASPGDLAEYGCAKPGGKPVGSAWACPGLFARGKADDVCASHYGTCADSAPIDLDACNSLPGFYVSQGLGKSQYRICRNIDPVNFVCGAPPAGYDNRFRFGCGGLSTPYILQACQRQCAGFDRAIECTGTGGDYDCRGSLTIGDDGNNFPSIGVLCCRQP